MMNAQVARIRIKQRFPHDVVRKLNGTDIKLLEIINYRSNLRAKASPSRAKYCIDAQAYFAKCLGVRRETISRAVTRLANLGILDVTHRRKIRGQWQTCLYRIRNWQWWRFGRMIRVIHQAGRLAYGLTKGEQRSPIGSPLRAPHRVSADSHKAIQQGEDKHKVPPEPRATVPPGTLMSLFKRVLAGERLAID